MSFLMHIRFARATMKILENYMSQLRERDRVGFTKTKLDLYKSKGQFDTASRNNSFTQNIFLDNSFIRNIFIGIQKIDFIKVFCNISYKYKNTFISLKLLKKTFNI